MDAGGAGLVEIVRGVALAAAGKPLPQAREVTDELGMEAIHLELSKYRYCTGFVIVGEHLDSVQLEDALARIGDSLLVVGDESMLKVHVHTDDPGAALTLASALGVIDEVEIANMHAQTVAERAEAQSDVSCAGPETRDRHRRDLSGRGRSSDLRGGESDRPRRRADEQSVCWRTSWRRSSRRAPRR